jgi:hypothetical protein
VPGFTDDVACHLAHADRDWLARDAVAVAARPARFS